MSSSASSLPRLLQIAIVVFLLVVVGYGVYLLIGDRTEVYSQQAVDGRGAPDSIQNRIGDDTYVLDDQPRGLVLLNYEVDRAGKVVMGSILNNTPEPLVSVEVTFDLYDAEDTMIETVGDTTSEVSPGAVWEFSAVYPPDISVARAERQVLRGSAKHIEGPLRNPDYPQNDPGGIQTEDDQ